ncbi:MAG TPA: hypothetical protein VGS19_06890 [Streptosporangiaceae bacterium]|nr:hypothetical protein [Streptosporangiaceae bacterium]
MNKSRIRVTIATASVMTAGLCLALAPAMASAQTGAVSHSHRTVRHAPAVDFKTLCSAHEVCTWSWKNYSHSHSTILAHSWRNNWYRTWGVFKFEPRSAVNGSGSALYIWDSSRHVAWCLAEGQGSASLDSGFNWFFITYDHPRCGQVRLPHPPGGWGKALFRTQN